MVNDTIIELRGVSKSYREGDRRRTVLNGVDTRVARGDFTVLLGRSGSGKSTLLHLLAGIDLPDEGTVRVCGCELERLSDVERTALRRRHIGFVFQFFNLIPTLTVWENTCLRLELNRRTSKADRTFAESLLEEVGLKDRRRSYPDRLSGGEQQRVAIAAALVHEPDLVLADEPTGNLDAETGHAVVELLDRLVRRQGRTLVMATHSREMIGAADHLLSIAEGRLLESTREPRP